MPKKKVLRHTQDSQGMFHKKPVLSIGSSYLVENTAIRG
ncbi:MAG: hypothetical protein CM1200mP34_3480 [Verrucomicrobiales bacterium]|nr:MAG: hypothetical protein CM1200mP34_3480 [Verrucomicrobiales bacterium]